MKVYHSPTKNPTFRNIMKSNAKSATKTPAQKTDKKHQLPAHFKILIRRNPANGSSDKSIKVATMKRIVVDRLGVDFNAHNMRRMKTPEQRKIDQE